LLETFSLPFVQKGLIEILLLAIPAGLIGTWVVLRGLAFFSHAIGTAAFPGLVLADGIGFSPALGAFGAAGVFAGLTTVLGRVKRSSTDSVTAIVLVGCLAGGVLLASDVFGSSSSVDNLLFGSLLAIGPADIRLAAVAALLALLTTAVFGHRWLARGFDEAGTPVGNVRVLDGLLLFIVALTVTASLNAIGALLISTLIVIPAATIRLLTNRISRQLAGSILLVAIEGTFGLWLSVETNAPPGATIAVASGVVFALTLVATRLGRNRLRALAVGALIVGGGVLTGCGSSSSDSGELKVVATTTQAGDLAGEVGGGKIDLTTILKPNTDPHEYEPRPSDVAAVADADLVFRSGGHLDEWTDQIIADSGSDAKVIDLSEGLPVKLKGEEEHEGEADKHPDEGEEEHGDEVDPHWWHDPLNVKAAVGEIEDALTTADPDRSAYFAKRADAFGAQVTQVNRQIAGCVKTVPEAERKIVTDHDAFSYFTRRYGVETVGTVIPALTTQAQPSAGDLAELEDIIKREHVKAVFPEESVPPALSDAVARDTGASTDYSLYGDTLGPAGSPGETWLGMMKSNTDNVMLGMTGGRRDCFGTGG
jgi:ABC-type Zn uptake system ZnuABC Zn-binding protein ZnuA/ABC-type Mn2+/Zn2+ transport system permease subunit